MQLIPEPPSKTVEEQKISRLYYVGVKDPRLSVTVELEAWRVLMWILRDLLGNGQSVTLDELQKAFSAKEQWIMDARKPYEEACTRISERTGSVPSQELAHCLDDLPKLFYAH